MELELLIIALSLFMVLLVENAILFMARHDVIRVIREYFIKNGIRVISVSRSGAIDISYAKPKEKYSFGKGEQKTTVYPMNKFHYDRNTGKEVLVLIEGQSTNLNLIAPPQKHARIMEQIVIQSSLYGYSKGVMRALSMLKENKIMLFLVAGSLLIGLISLVLLAIIMQSLGSQAI